MLSLVYGFGYEMIAVMSVTTITSVTGYWPSLLVLRKRHQYKLHLINNAPTMPYNWQTKHFLEFVCGIECNI